MPAGVLAGLENMVRQKPEGDVAVKVADRRWLPAVEAREVQDLLESFCGDEKGAVSEPLVVTGATWSGMLFTSQPVPNIGIDQLVKSNK